MPLLVQVCADQFTLRRLGRITRRRGVRVGLHLRRLDAAAGARGRVDARRRALIFFALFVGFSCIQFWTADATEFANAFTYGGNTMTQYPLTIFPREVMVGADVRRPRWPS